MPRPRKCRRVCSLPDTKEFTPVCDGEGRKAVILTVDEYETIRLIDKEGYSQEECGDYMRIARTTVQQIYTNARKKIADVLVDGLPLRIEGGDYQLCEGGAPHCRRRMCHRRQEMSIMENAAGEFIGMHTTLARPETTETQTTESNITERKTGGTIMRIAVTYENGQVFQHFGHTEAFKVYDVENGEIVKAEVVSTNGQGHGALATVLSGLNVEVLICGGIGGGAQNALTEAGIKFYGGVSGDADLAVAKLLTNTLVYNPNVKCNHHGEGHHHEGGSCGSHGCGNH